MKAVYVGGEWHDLEWFRAEHAEYLKSNYWKTRAAGIRTARRYKCEVCYNRGWQVHHLNYDRWPHAERDSDLQLLCDGCHRATHGIAETDLSAL